MKFLLKYLLLPLLLMAAGAGAASAQFRTDAFTQSYNDDTTPTDSVDVMFSFKNYFRGITHKEYVKIGVVFAGSTLFVGGEQIYNEQYWKLPVIYGGLAGTVGAGIYFNSRYRSSAAAGEPIDRYKTIGTACFIGAGLVYWGALMDGMVNFRRDEYPQAGKATIYSLLLPGLGQAYNGEYWKIPVYWGIMIGGLHFYKTNRINYERFRRIYNAATSKDEPYTGNISAQTALYYRNMYRRYRDYSVLTIAAGYLLQAIDANVFSYMYNFEVKDDLHLSLEPTVFPAEALYSQNSPVPTAGFGFRFGLTF